jgi:hypothetical protein
LPGLALALLVGVLHVHHAPSHDSDASFAELLAAAHAAELDFLVLAEHADPDLPSGPLPAAERAGLHAGPGGRSLRVLVAVEFGTADGHLLAYDVDELVPATDRPGAEVIADVHAAGGFAVVPHPFTHGGWHDWDAPFDGLEVHNNASAFQRLLGPLLPLRLLVASFDRPAVLRSMLPRPERELERWESLLMAGRAVVGFSGADAHRNVSLLGWQLDPYSPMFSAVQTVCPGDSLEPKALWAALRGGRCWIRYEIHAGHGTPSEVRFPSGRRELQLDDGARVLEIRNPIIEAP